MPMYDFECSSIKCLEENGKPYQFEVIQSLKETAEGNPICPKCKSSLDVKKVILKAVPKSQSWRTY